MPTLDAYVYDARGQILVETNWSDAPSARSVQVRRVHADGSTYPLRSYVWPDLLPGEYQHLSGGWAGFWDTEAPLDQAFTYEATAATSTGATVIISTATIYDLFERTVANGWGSATSGQVWTVDTGAAAQFSVNGVTGLHTHAAPGTAVVSKLTGILRDVEVYAEASTSSIANTAEASLFVRYTDISNWYRAVINFATGTLTIASSTVTLGTLANAIVPTLGPVALRVRMTGQVIRAKVWTLGNPEPTGWSLTSLPSAQYATGSIALGDFDQTAAKTFTWDNLSAFDLDAPAGPITVTSGPYTLASGGDFYLRNPTRPCDDRRVSLCFDPDVPCIPGSGIFFADMTQESYQANSVKLLPTNARRPLAVARERRDADAQLVLVTREFADRDAVLALNQPGGPLQWVAPPAYGIPDRYITVDTVDVSRGLPDMRFTPRLITMPYSTVDRPVGPTQGVCGARFEDLCDTYATWDLAAATGLAYSTLVTGSPAALGWRTWALVLATWATWADVLAAEPTWRQVLVP